MNTKKYVIAFAICFGAFLTVQATNVIELDDQKTEFRKSHLKKIPTHG